MKWDEVIDQLGFVAKVAAISIALAIACKTLAPHLSIPATSTTSLAIVLTPAIVVGVVLFWQLWTSDHADATHSGHD
ncbi:hypothetical protein PN498_26200 [Oscillatoria sp. CS-180]|uniref:hypothetical protein n=1 Tax=Oscillatoria sp. CS-180 TaxID=3021720 RepID=UPI00232EF104|nr:hypothetical protein [Oscillatoria sp. CS-180]MDB9529510.1 hypothetical protein [Oscillatoria sp. CS-180]